MKVSPLCRTSYWEDGLATYLDRIHDDPFKWGEHDCCLFAANAVKAMTGTDIAADFRGNYDTRIGSAQALRDYGAGTITKTFTAWFGPSKHTAFAQRGDLVMRGNSTVGVCVGLYSYFVGIEEGHEGLVFIPTSECSRAFTVAFELEAQPDE